MKVKVFLIFLFLSLATVLSWRYWQVNQIVDLTQFEQGKVEKDYWQLVEQPPFQLSDLVIQLKTSACIMLQYDINEQGQFENPVILKEVAGDSFKQPLIESLFRWRWQPSGENSKVRQPIRTMRFFSIGFDKSITTQCFAYRGKTNVVFQ